MSYKSILVTAMATVALFGVTVSGCNRSRDTRTAMQNTRAETGRGTTRPAEVLSASAYRPPSRAVAVAAPAPAPAARVQTHPQMQPQAPVMLAQTPQPTPQPMYQTPQPTYQYAAAPAQQQRPRPASQPMTQAEYFASAQAYAYSAPAPAPLPPPPAARPVQYTPDLVVARANLPAPRPAAYAPPAAPVAIPAAYVRAPIPELEPPRYPQLTPTPPSGRSAAEIMIADLEQQSGKSEIQNALAPLPVAPQADARQGWVASPATAMRGGR